MGDEGGGGVKPGDIRRQLVSSFISDISESGGLKGAGGGWWLG